MSTDYGTIKPPINRDQTASKWPQVVATLAGKNKVKYPLVQCLRADREPKRVSETDFKRL